MKNRRRPRGREARCRGRSTRDRAAQDRGAGGGVGSTNSPREQRKYSRAGRWARGRSMKNGPSAGVALPRVFLRRMIVRLGTLSARLASDPFDPTSHLLGSAEVGRRGSKGVGGGNLNRAGGVRYRNRTTAMEECVEPDVVEVNVASLGSIRRPVSDRDPQGEGGDRYLPIWIGPSEASAIATEWRGSSSAAPSPHGPHEDAGAGAARDPVPGRHRGPQEQHVLCQVFVQNGDEDVSRDDAGARATRRAGAALERSRSSRRGSADHTAEDAGRPARRGRTSTTPKI